MNANELKEKWKQLNISADNRAVFEFYANCICDEEDREVRFECIVDMQEEIFRLNHQFVIPLNYFMRDHKHRIADMLDKTHHEKTLDYKAHPEMLVKDLLNYIYCLLGYGAFYQCPTECNLDNQDH